MSLRAELNIEPNLRDNMNVGWYDTMPLVHIMIVTVLGGEGLGQTGDYLCVGGLKGGRDKVSVLWELAESGGKV